MTSWESLLPVITSTQRFYKKYKETCHTMLTGFFFFCYTQCVTKKDKERRLWINYPVLKDVALSPLVDQTQRFERYVIKEYIGTVGCTLQSYALRYVIKQF